jgi:hypothetical protein
MIIRVKETVKGTTRNRWLARLLFQCGIIVLLIMTLNSTGVAADSPQPAGAVGFYVKDGKTTWLIPGKGIPITYTPGLTLADIEKLYSSTAKAESSIVHSIPSCPVIIDGTIYAAEKITQFNGKRLRFVTGPDNNLYAFTTLRGFEQFQLAQFGQTMMLRLDSSSYFYQNANFGGSNVWLIPGAGITDLNYVSLDNAISSTIINTSSQWAYLFDSVNYVGDWYGMPPGSSYSNLIYQGWNDRASSIWINQN